MSAVCPVCGVAVVPGYVRCPRCHAALPVAAPRRNASTIDPGGTAVARTEFPRWLVWGGVIAGVLLVLYLVIGWISDAFSDYRSTSKKAAAGSGSETDTTASPTTGAPRPTPPTPQTPQTQVDSSGVTTTTGSPPSRVGPNPSVPAADLERALRRQRLWSTVEISGSRIDVRSASCSDGAMSPLLESARPALHNGGLTRLRCLEQSGRVVFERDL